MDALVLSGGGCKGAFAGGVADCLLNHQGRDYDLLVGSSTGALLVPLLALGETERLKELYTSIQQNDIFDISPFTIRRSRGRKTIGIHHWNVLRMFFRKSRTFGSSQKLRELIGSTLTPEDYERIRESGKEVLVAVSNFSTDQVEYKSVREEAYEDFCDWMWASSNVVPFMSLVEKDGYQYGDGGFSRYVPIQHAIRMGATEVDTVILKPDSHVVNRVPVRNPFQLLFRIISFMMNQIGLNDLALGTLAAAGQEVSIRCFHTPRILTENTLIFDSDEMTSWWEEGYKQARDGLPLCRLVQ